MTRKKFVKKLMACGLQRDDAVLFAQIVNHFGDSYGPIWEDLSSYVKNAERNESNGKR